MGTKSSMSLVRTMPSTPSVERVRTKNCLPDCSRSMAAILTGAGKCLGRLKTGFWYSGMAEPVSSAAPSAAGAARGEAASRAVALTKSRRFIGISIARGGEESPRLHPDGQPEPAAPPAANHAFASYLATGRPGHELRRHGLGGRRPLLGRTDSGGHRGAGEQGERHAAPDPAVHTRIMQPVVTWAPYEETYSSDGDRKSTRLNSSHLGIS